MCTFNETSDERHSKVDEPPKPVCTHVFCRKSPLKEDDIFTKDKVAGPYRHPL